MKNELSWIPLASGSEAIELASRSRLSATITQPAITTRSHDFDFGQKVENCVSFIDSWAFFVQSWRRNRTKWRDIESGFESRYVPLPGGRLQRTRLGVGLRYSSN